MIPWGSKGGGTPYSPQGRTERLIAAGRVILAAFSLLAIWLDPSEPARYARITYALLSGYFVYALVMALVVWRLDAPSGRLRLLAHGLDLFVFALFMFFTHGPASPFFVYFVFSLVCATLRWQWRGALWTAAVALAAVVLMAMYPTDLFRDPTFELNRFLIRVVYLAVVATLLGYLGAFEQRLRSGLVSLATWPRTVPGGAPALARVMLEYSARILGAPRMLLAWEEDEDPWLYLASWAAGGFQFTREPPGVFGALAAEPLAGASFFCADACGPSPDVIHTSPAGLRKWQGSPFHRDFQARFGIASVLSLPLKGKSLKGYLLALDKRRMTSDDLVLGEIAAKEVVNGLDLFHLLKQLRESAAAEERVRLARNLHDGLLQFLTGAALQLETVQRLMESDPLTARQRVLEIQQLIVAEQQELRSHIRELKPSLPGVAAEDSNLAGRLEDLAERIKRQWGVGVEMNLGHLEVRALKNLWQEIYFIVHESLINAVRHAGPSVVKVDLDAGTDGVRITVADNGHGFPFKGRYDQVSLTQNRLGPATLMERISSLGGSLAIDSSDAGARLEITLPLEGKGG